MELNAIVNAAKAAFESWAHSSGAVRATLLFGLADAIELNRAHLVEIADQETYLGVTRLNGEVDRTCYQLRGFAAVANSGDPFAFTEDLALAQAPPAGHPHLRRVRIPLGPVAMFSASNFPFAFSVLGGDTASALAAGCSVIVKGHSAHKRLSCAVYEIAQAVVLQLELPPGLIGFIESEEHSLNLALVGHPDIKAVAFTGSLSGGLALNKQIQSRSVPIPFYGELGSVNPIVVFPQALEKEADATAKLLANSIAQGSGQFCTRPAVVVVLRSAASISFLDAVARHLDASELHPMLSGRMRSDFEARKVEVLDSKLVRSLTSERGTTSVPGAFLGVTTADAFIQNLELREEIFGPACIGVLANSLTEMEQVLSALVGVLTATVWGADQEDAALLPVIRKAQEISGRLLFAGVPTGVAVTEAQQHGGPWPSATQPMHTSVGYRAIDRFLRPVAIQSPPDWVIRRAGIPI